MTTFFVCGVPAPQGSKRAIPIKRGGVHTGKVSLLESAGDKLKQWRRAVSAVAAQHEPITGPVGVHVTFGMHRPKSHYGTGKNAGVLKPSSPQHHAVKPDIDKLARATLDALTTSRLIEDDSRVIDLRATKIYIEPGGTTGAAITITPWTGEQP